MSDKGLIKQRWIEKYPRPFPKADSSVMPVPGAIAVSKAGRDRYRCFILTSVLPPEDFQKNLHVTVADGSLRSVSKPKEKNLSHLILVGMSQSAAVMIADGCLTDEAAREIVSEFQNKQIS